MVLLLRVVEHVAEVHGDSPVDLDHFAWATQSVPVEPHLREDDLSHQPTEFVCG